LARSCSTSYANPGGVTEAMGDVSCGD